MHGGVHGETRAELSKGSSFGSRGCYGAIVNTGFGPGRAGIGTSMRARPSPQGEGIPMPQSSIRRYLKHGTLPQLRVFEASVRLGSLARAAEELHMAPPTACIQVKKLSETVGSPLFEHVGKRLYPTAVGRQVYASCEEVFRAFAALEESLGRVRDLSTGELRLAATSTARYFAPRLLGTFSERHPGIAAALRIENRRALVERMSRNEDDLYLLADPARDGGIVTQAVLPNPLVVMARRDHPLAAQRAIPFHRLATEPFLMREEGSGTRQAVLDLFSAHGLAPRVRMELSSNESIREAILAGLGVSVLSRYTFGAEGEDGHLACLDVEGFPLESQWHFAYPAGKQPSAAARAFMDFARTQARAMALEGLGATTH
jgi:DNA-binding transcriptional LysR family regulator